MLFLEAAWAWSSSPSKHSRLPIVDAAMVTLLEEEAVLGMTLFTPTGLS